MGKRVPRFIAKQWGSAHNFRSDKRRIVREMLKMNGKLRQGCFHFPCDPYAYPVDEIDKLLLGLQKDLSVKNWGK